MPKKCLLGRRQGPPVEFFARPVHPVLCATGNIAIQHELQTRAEAELTVGDLWQYLGLYHDWPGPDLWRRQPGQLCPRLGLHDGGLCRLGLCDL